MNLYQVTAFVRHLLASSSTAGHGVHSPYIYEFLTKTVRNESNPDIVSRVERLRHEMLSDPRTIRVTDLGAGPAGGAGGKRRVSEIAASASLPARQVALLSRIAESIRNNSVFKGEQNKNGIILELGTSLGISTLALSLAAPERQVVTVEGCPVLAGIAGENLRKHAATNTRVINMEFSQALATLRHRGTRVSMAFIDGNHRAEALIQYTETLKSLGEEMIIVADDINLNREMYNAWCSLTKSGIASASMETFRFGILICINNITPGRYRIRY